MATNTLHIVASSQGARRCQSSLASGDTVLLIEDAVLLCRDNTWRPPVSVVVLEDDLSSHNIAADNMRTVDYLGFVDLCCQHRHCLSW